MAETPGELELLTPEEQEQYRKLLLIKHYTIASQDVDAKRRAMTQVTESLACATRECNQVRFELTQLIDERERLRAELATLNQREADMRAAVAQERDRMQAQLDVRDASLTAKASDVSALQAAAQEGLLALAEAKAAFARTLSDCHDETSAIKTQLITLLDRLLAR